MEMTAAAKTETSLLPKTRVWASNFVDPPFSSPSTSLTSTLRWGSEYRCDRTASGELEQRFYTSQFGRFMSADRFQRAAKINDSGSWNKYSYTRGDPVNRFDRSGTEDWCTDEECDDDPCDEDPTIIGCTESGGGGGAPPKKNKKPKPSKPTCNNDSPQSQFVAANYSAASSLSAEFNVPTDWILGWAASETGYGSSGPALNNGNYYNQTTNNWSGAITCGGGTVSGYACFASFLASATSVLESKYGAAIQADLAANPTMSAASIFQQIANLGFDPKGSTTNAGYGGRVSNVIQGVDDRIKCLNLNATPQ